jgi:hypothetical protein
MKNNILLFLACSIWQLAQSQTQWSTSGNNIYNTNSGNVGIGTSSPLYNLHIAGTSAVNALIQNTGDGFASLLLVSNNKTWMWSKRPVAENNALALYYNDGTNWIVPPCMSFLTNGNVLIGQATQVNSAYILDVNGSARANKMVVNTTGADYVFDSAYRLFSLREVEQRNKP